MISVQTKLSPNQIRLEYQPSGGEKIVLKNNSTKLSQMFPNEKQVTLTLKNLGLQLDYLHLYLIEYSFPLAFWTFFFLINLGKVNSCYWVLFLMGFFHYTKRLLESKYVHIFSNETAPLLPSMRNFLFYGIVFGICVPLEIYYIRKDSYIKREIPNGFWDKLWIFLFFLFETCNFYCHWYLRTLRVNKDGSLSKERKIPNGLFFDSVISPNYSFEILSWLSFIFLSRSIATLFFITVGGAIMFVWAAGKKKKMLELNLS